MGRGRPPHPTLSPTCTLATQDKRPRGASSGGHKQERAGLSRAKPVHGTSRQVQPAPGQPGLGASVAATRGWGTAETKAPALGWEGGASQSSGKPGLQVQSSGKRKTGAPRRAFGFPDDLGLRHWKDCAIRLLGRPSLGPGGSGRRGRSAGTYRLRRGGRRPRAATARAQKGGSGVRSVAGRPSRARAAAAVTSGAPRSGTQASRVGGRFCPPRPAMIEVISGQRDLSSELPPRWPGYLS